MDLSAGILGMDATRQLQKRITSHLLTIGSDHFTRRDFARIDCFNFLAAQNLSTLLNKHLKVDNTADVYLHVNPAELAIPRLGVFALAVLGAAFELKGLGGDNPLENWLKRHKVEVVTFHTMKLHELEDGHRERKALRDRKHARRNVAHGLRVARFEKRSGTHG
jgi:hypothetical protein